MEFKVGFSCWHHHHAHVAEQHMMHDKSFAWQLHTMYIHTNRGLVWCTMLPCRMLPCSKVDMHH